MKRKFFLIIILILSFHEVFALKIRNIENIAPKIASWVEEYYKLEGKYPNQFEDVIGTDFKSFDYDVYKIYNDLLNDGFKAEIKGKSLVIIDSRNKKTCIYNFYSKDFSLYHNQTLIKVFKTN